MYHFTLKITVYHIRGGSTGQTTIHIEAESVEDARRKAIHGTMALGLFVASIEQVESKERTR